MYESLAVWVNEKKRYLNVRCGNLGVLLIGPSNKYIPEDRPPLKQKSSRRVNSYRKQCKKNVKFKRIVVRKVNKIMISYRLDPMTLCLQLGKPEL